MAMEGIVFDDDRSFGCEQQDPGGLEAGWRCL